MVPAPVQFNPPLSVSVLPALIVKAPEDVWLMAPLAVTSLNTATAPDKLRAPVITEASAKVCVPPVRLTPVPLNVVVPL